jgi:hypothetical protein
MSQQLYSKNSFRITLAKNEKYHHYLPLSTTLLISLLPFKRNALVLILQIVRLLATSHVPNKNIKL